MNRLRTIVVLLLACWLSACGTTAEQKQEAERKERLANTLTQLGVEYFRRGQLQEARDNLVKALEIAPDHSQANNVMGLLQWRLKEYAEAERHFRRAIGSGKGNSEAWNNFGVFLCERGHIDTAEAAFKRALDDPLYRTPAEANVNAGVCLARKPAPAEAEKYFREALKLDPRQPRALSEMAKLCYSDGRTLCARGFINRYFDVGQDNPEILLLASRVEGALGNKDAEASYAVRLRGKFPDSPEAVQLNRPQDNRKNTGRTK